MTSFHPDTATAERYATFSRVEAHLSSPLYEVLAAGISTDPGILSLLERVPPEKRQPNLLFAGVLYLGGVQPDYPTFRRFVLEHEQDVLELLVTRKTQTNEVGRCAVLLPFLAQLPGPLALLEVGASAGLCLLPDRYAYHYDDAELVGDPTSPVRLACRTRGPVPIPSALPTVVWRRGIDTNPIDVRDNEATRWLKCCIWPDQRERLTRLQAAIEIARHDPPPVVQGDLVDLVVEVAATAPLDATLVIFHSAVLTYLPAERRRTFAELVSKRPWIWISNEGPGVVESLQVTTSLPAPNYFMEGIVSSKVRAFAHPHGSWIEWV